MLNGRLMPFLENTEIVEEQGGFRQGGDVQMFCLLGLRWCGVGKPRGRRRIVLS